MAVADDRAAAAAAARKASALDLAAAEAAEERATAEDRAAAEEAAAEEAAAADEAAADEAAADDRYAEADADAAAEVAAQPGALKVLWSRVTAPVRAIAWPSTVTPVVTVTEASAMMVPLKVDPVPSVAELATCQKTLQA